MEEGIAIASAYPIQNDIALDLPHSNPLVKRLVIVSDIDSPIGLVHVLTTHLNPYGENTRREQMAYLVDLLNTFPHDEAIIVMGDLNDTMDSGLFDSLQKLGFRDIADGKMITYDPKNPYADGSPAAGLDHIFYRTTVLKEMDSGYLFKDKPVSDHYGVWGKFCRLE
jgi:endonuclease/exonuclease/phosphatase family metal-dependent hydrolase